MTIRTYTENPYLKDIKANVVNKYEEDDKFFIELDRTIFYPHLVGGQPRDYGTIDGKQVLNVFEEDNKVIHVLSEDIYTDKVDLVIDWNRRFDIMQQHTGQHLLSANIYNLYSAETDGFYFGDNYVSIEITKDDFGEKEAKQVEYLCNRMIQDNFKITSYIPDEEDLTDIPIRNIPKTDNDIRIVEIDGIDYNPCCGTHLNTTGELGILKIKRWNQVGDNTRIEFLCGNRALQDYDMKNNYIYDLSQILNSREKDIIQRVESILEREDEFKKEIRNLKDKIADTKARLYLEEANSYDDIKYIVNSFEDVDVKDINRIVSVLKDEDNLVQIYGITKPDNEFGQFIVSISENLQLNLVEIFNNIKEELKIRGGGNNYSIHGGASLDILNNVIRTFYSEIRNYFKKND